HQENITQLNRDNERLLAENRTTLRELHSQTDQLKQANTQNVAFAEQQQHAHTQCALLEERLRSAQDENAELKQGMTDAQQQSRMLELLLTKKEAALENLQIRLDQPDKPKPAKKKPSDQT
ncbi:integrase, partial [Pseudomonas syringae pv. syringae FF5]